MLVSVIVPCFNESAVIEATLERLAQVMEGCGHGSDYSYELIFIDDGSRDDTLDKLKTNRLVNNHLLSKLQFHHKAVVLYYLNIFLNTVQHYILEQLYLIEYYYSSFLLFSCYHSLKIIFLQQINPFIQKI